MVWPTIIVLLVAVITVLSFYYLWTHPAPIAMYPAQARADIKSRDIQVVVDVRTAAEWATGHFPNAYHIPIHLIGTALPQHIPDRSTGILFYCRTGHRAAIAARVAQELGYTNVAYLDRGSYADLEPKYVFREDS